MVDRIADYLTGIRDRHVLPDSEEVYPGYLRHKLPSRAPEEGEPFENIAEDIDNIVLPGVSSYILISLFRVRNLKNFIFIDDTLAVAPHARVLPGSEFVRVSPGGHDVRGYQLFGIHLGLFTSFSTWEIANLLKSCQKSLKISLKNL